VAATPQRIWRAACPHCGAPVAFASAASASAVCTYCRSTLLRDGETLRRIGVSAELFDDHSPLQLGVRGQRQGVAFTLVGRLQYGYEGGSWNEWHALFENGQGLQRSAWLSEDNGAYVIAFDAPLPADAPALDRLRAGARVLADGRAWDVASVVQAHLIAAQGELPRPPRLDGAFTVIDLRNSAGEVATLDGSDPAQAGWAVGRSVLLAELALSGLKDGSEKTLDARAFECPSCGAALDVRLSSTQSIACGQCHAVVDVSQGVGAELAHFAQNNPGAIEPQLPLGRSGPLALGGPLLHWQVVGYLERCTVPDAAGDETWFWREYLLYEPQAGFAFLVDSDDGWSWVQPITGVPVVRGGQAQWQGVSYRQREAYQARVSWVQGEFYWRVRRDEVAAVTDYEGSGGSDSDGARRLSQERSASEVTWSAGATLSAAEVAQAFALEPAARAGLQRDVGPVAFGGATAARMGLIVVVAVIVLVLLLSRCSRDDCAQVKDTFGAASTEYRQCSQNQGGSGVRTGGGSYGGWSSGGGGHK
jgi:hypothetical protein